MAGFGISGAKPWGSATTKLVSLYPTQRNTFTGSVQPFICNMISFTGTGDLHPQHMSTKTNEVFKIAQSYT
jgi:hypothetical protein